MKDLLSVMEKVGLLVCKLDGSLWRAVRSEVWPVVNHSVRRHVSWRREGVFFETDRHHTNDTQTWPQLLSFTYFIIL